jgi:hypothetical protein
LERSTDQNNFTTVARIDKKPIFTYTYVDLDAPFGVVYYRLKTFYLNGDVAYSQILTVKRKNEESFRLLNVSPNPASEVFYLLLQSDKQVHLSVEVYNSTGQLMIRQKRIANKGITRLPIDFAKFNQGTYYIKLTQTGQTLVKTILKSD